MLDMHVMNEKNDDRTYEKYDVMILLVCDLELDLLLSSFIDLWNSLHRPNVYLSSITSN